MRQSSRIAGNGCDTDGMTDDRALVRSKDVAEAFGVDPATVYRWERAGIIRAASRTAGGQSRYRLSEVRQQLAEHRGDVAAGWPEDEHNA